jgi:hypothetical protein
VTDEDKRLFYTPWKQWHRFVVAYRTVSRPYWYGEGKTVSFTDSPNSVQANITIGLYIYIYHICSFYYVNHCTQSVVHKLHMNKTLCAVVGIIKKI